jgi:molecular chaperone DnaK
MKRSWSALVVAGAFAATAALGAQEAAQGPNPANTPPADRGAQPGQRPQPGPSTQAQTPNTVTVTGCVQNAPMASTSDSPGAGQSQTGRPGAVAGNSAQTGQRFVLNSAQMASTGDAARRSVGTTGTAVTTYQLEGQTADVSKHLNHRVEITGMLQSSSASPTGSASAAAGSTAAGSTLRVTSVRMLASTCDDATKGTSGVETPGPAGTSGSSTSTPSPSPSPSVPNEPASPANPEPRPEPQPEQRSPAPPPQQ